MENLRRFMFTGLLMLVVVVSGCGGGGGSAPASGTAPGENSIATAIRNSAPLSSCPTGGISVDAGIDDNANGVLDTAEITSTQYVCNGTNGTNGTSGTSGLNALVAVTAEPSGANCTTGGKKVSVGPDTNANGALDTSEITSSNYICNGIDGTSGTNGTNGTSGTTGTSGLNALVAVTAEPSGANCTTGGKKVSVGPDTNANGALDTSEITSSNYICNGANGTNGTNGTNGINTLVAIVTEPVGANCASGGSKATSGLDTNANGILDAGEITSTTYVCNGATGPAGPGVTWVNVAASSSVQAVSNTGYLASSATQVTVTLPVAPVLGDVVSVSGIGAGGWKVAQNSGQSIIAKGIAGSIGEVWMPRDAVRGWRSVASSSDGTKLVAAVNGGALYTSVDSGVTWIGREAVRFWLSVVSSADGTKLVALVNGGGSYISVDSGLSWTPMAAGGEAVALSMDGVNLVIAHPLAGIYQTFDSGATWAFTNNILNVKALASSADGTKVVAGAFGGNIYTSVDSGVTWTARDSARNWLSVASSADGTKLVAVVWGGQIYTSVDSGVTWTARDAARNWQSVASSADGTKLVAAVNYGGFYTSVDSGVTWTARNGVIIRNWQSVASSADGTKLVAAVMTGNIYTSTPEISPSSIVSTSVGITGSLSGGQYDAVDLQCVDVNTFMVRGYAGYLVVQ